MMKTKQDNDVIDHTGVVYAKSKLNYHDLSAKMRSITKSRQDNDMIHHGGVISTEYDTKL